MSLGVRIVYRNAKMEPVCTKCYDLREYTDMLRNDLLRIITDVEDMAYQSNDGKEKDEWPDAAWMTFCKIKHKILDKAGDIGRLPETIIEKEDEHGPNYLGQERKHQGCVFPDSSCGAEEHEGFSSSGNHRG